MAPAARLRETTDELVGEILAVRARGVRLQKELMIRWRQTDLATAVRFGINAFATAYATGEPQEGARAFLDKRRPTGVGSGGGAPADPLQSRDTMP